MAQVEDFEKLIGEPGTRLGEMTLEAFDVTRIIRKPFSFEEELAYFRTFLEYNGGAR